MGMMSKVMETEYIMHIKGTDPYPKGDIQRLARDFQFYSTATRIMADILTTLMETKNQYHNIFIMLTENIC